MLYTSFCFLFALFFGCQLMVGFGVYYEPSFGNLYSCIKLLFGRGIYSFDHEISIAVTYIFPAYWCFGM